MASHNEPSVEAVGDVEKILARAHAEGVAEGRAATLREVVAALEQSQPYGHGFVAAGYAAARKVIEARFPSEGTG